MEATQIWMFKTNVWVKHIKNKLTTGRKNDISKTEKGLEACLLSDIQI